MGTVCDGIVQEDSFRPTKGTNRQNKHFVVREFCTDLCETVVVCFIVSSQKQRLKFVKGEYLEFGQIQELLFS